MDKAVAWDKQTLYPGSYFFFIEVKNAQYEKILGERQYFFRKIVDVRIEQPAP